MVNLPLRLSDTTLVQPLGRVQQSSRSRATAMENLIKCGGDRKRIVSSIERNTAGPAWSEGLRRPTCL